MNRNAPLKFLFSCFLALLISTSVFSQQYSSDETKSIEKAKSYRSKDKYDKAIETLIKVQRAHFYDGDLWELRCEFEYDRYNDQVLKDYALYVKKGGKDNPSFDVSKLKSREYRQEMINACSVATLFCDHQETASMVLHEEFIEPSRVDSAVSDDAKEELEKGSDDYSNSNYGIAIRAYEKALKLDSNYYYAIYKIAMCYYLQEKYDEAIPYFRKAIAHQPKMLNPRQHLVTCLMKEKTWQDAYEACVDGIIAYPDIRFFTKMEEIADKLGKTFKRHWMPRDYIPSMISSNSQAAIKDEPWSFYRDAKEKISDYCTDQGIIKRKVDFTEQKYLETYSWEFMLKKTTTDDVEFGFARKMQAEGYLDCFAMVSMYHIAFSEQYEDFASKNADRIRKYIGDYLVK